MYVQTTRHSVCYHNTLTFLNPLIFRNYYKFEQRFKLEEKNRNTRQTSRGSYLGLYRKRSPKIWCDNLFRIGNKLDPTMSQSTPGSRTILFLSKFGIGGQLQICLSPQNCKCIQFFANFCPQTQLSILKLASCKPHISESKS